LRGVHRQLEILNQRGFTLGLKFDLAFGVGRPAQTHVGSRNHYLTAQIFTINPFFFIALNLTKEDAQEKLWNQKDIQSQCQEELLKAAEEIQKLSQHLAHRDESQIQVLEDAIGQPGRGSNKTVFELREILAKSVEREAALQKKVGQK